MALGSTPGKHNNGAEKGGDWSCRCFGKHRWTVRSWLRHCATSRQAAG